jgi:hypothetical protein
MKGRSRTETARVAGNGLLHRRLFLTAGAAAIGAGTMPVVLGDDETEQKMTKASIVNGCVIDKRTLYLAMASDELEMGDDFSFLTFYRGDNPQEPWITREVPWYTISVCVWEKGPFGEFAYVALSTEGDIGITRPDGAHLTEFIPGAGMRRPWSKEGRGRMHRLRQIGAHLYAAGDGFRMFRRDERNWTDLSDPVDRQYVWVAPNGQSIKLNPVLMDLNGVSENAIYAVGRQPEFVGTTGKMRSIINFFDGSGWRTINENIPGVLTSICPSERGGIYIGGWHVDAGTKPRGLLLYGDHISGFEEAGRIYEDIISIAEYQGIVYIASTEGLFATYGPGRSITAAANLSPPLKSIGWLEAKDGVLWAFDSKDLAIFDGKDWTRIHHPAF